MKKPRRYNFCENLEKDIQKRAVLKDGSFCLWGKWIRFIKEQLGFQIYEVDGEWVRNNLSIMFGHGGHGYVHEFIPHNEIWIDPYHYDNNFYVCGCLNIKNKKRATKEFIHDTILHEITEYEEMKKGKPFWKAHQIALK